MTLENEFIQKIGDETSDFFRRARKKLKLGYASDDQWTVDRSRNIVLKRIGSGMELDSLNEEYWVLLMEDREYRFTTKRIEMRPVSSDRIHIERRISFTVTEGVSIPDELVFAAVKDALLAYKDFGAISRYATCDLVLTFERDVV